MLMATLRTVIFYLFAVPLTMIWAAICGVLAHFIPYPKRYYVVIGTWAKMIDILTIYVLGITCRVHGLENIPAQPGVIISNHQSAWETYKLQQLFNPQSQVAKASLLKIPLFGWTFAKLHPIAIDRNNRRGAMTQIIEEGTVRIRQGSYVLIFPEGTRTDPEHPLPFRKGGAVLAKYAQCPIIPVTHNSGKYWRNDGFAKYPGIVDLYIHPAIHTEQDSPEALIFAAERIVIGKLNEISGIEKTPEANKLADQL